jgi:hydroxyacid-oxoacid transhydrogenase
MVRDYLPRAVEDPSDDEARGQMLLAAAIAGIGFGNAGVHLPHGMSYPVAGRVKDFHPAGYDVDHALVPHGISVILNTPAVVRFTAPADPGRHVRAAQALGAEIDGVAQEDAGEVLADQVISLMKTLQMPNGLAAVGYNEGDVPALVEGTLPQHRVTKLSPIEAGPEELTRLFTDALTIW